MTTIYRNQTGAAGMLFAWARLMRLCVITSHGLCSLVTQLALQKHRKGSRDCSSEVFSFVFWAALMVWQNSQRWHYTCVRVCVSEDVCMSVASHIYKYLKNDSILTMGIFLCFKATIGIFVVSCVYHNILNIFKRIQPLTWDDRVCTHL